MNCFLDKDFTHNKTKSYINFKLAKSLVIFNHENLLCEPVNKDFPFAPTIVKEETLKVPVIEKESGINGERKWRKGELAGIIQTIVSFDECKDQFTEESMSRIYLDSGSPEDLNLDRDETDALEDTPSRVNRDEFEKKIDCSHIEDENKKQNLKTSYGSTLDIF